jgi:hypothetical protein
MSEAAEALIGADEEDGAVGALRLDDPRDSALDLAVGLTRSPCTQRILDGLRSIAAESF